MNIFRKIKYVYITTRMKIKKRRESIIDNMLYGTNHKLSSYEEKSIELWKTLIKNEKSTLLNDSDNTRHISKDNLLIILKPLTGVEYILTIINNEENFKTFYSFHIPEKHAKDMIRFFDKEVAKIMTDLENKKIQLIDNSIDKLIKKEKDV